MPMIHAIRSLLAIAIALTQVSTAETAPATSWPQAQPQAIAAWQDLRFGMFIHWGPISILEKEIGWSRGTQVKVEQYDSLYKQFNPTGFNADEWVGIAKSAGMKYIVLVTKHHDGFCLWDSKLTDYTIMNTPFRRDVVKELSEACRKSGLAFGIYYSVEDNHHPDYPYAVVGMESSKRQKFDLEAYREYLLGQTAELITTYGPVLTVWNDAWGAYRKHGAATIQAIRKLQPDILINDRSGAGFGSGDYDTPEQMVGSFELNRPWESCMTVSAHNHWSWGGPKDGVKPFEKCLKMLIRAAGGNGNLLLNVGPRPDGIIDPEQAGLIKQIGAWLETNGESIYATRGGPFIPGTWGTSTRKGKRIYLHVFKFDQDTLILPAIPATVTSARLLTGGAVTFQQTASGVALTVPAAHHAAVDTLIALDIDRSAMDLTSMKVRPTDGTIAVDTCSASSIFNYGSPYRPEFAFDQDPETSWTAAPGTTQGWLAAHLDEPTAVAGIRIVEGGTSTGAVQHFELQYLEDDMWKTIFAGTTIGRDFQKSFPPVTAHEFRLNIISSTRNPSIVDMEFTR